jgi:hypothetical protein
MTAGCAAIVVGAGAGAGTLAYFEGELKKAYEADYDKTVKACSDALSGLKIPVTEKPSDALQTIFRAMRPDGTPVTVKAVRLNEQVTEVSVRTGIVGLWDKNVSLQIHESIRREINRVQQPTPVISSHPTRMIHETHRKRQVSWRRGNHQQKTSLNPQAKTSLR